MINRPILHLVALGLLVTACSTSKFDSGAKTKNGSTQDAAAGAGPANGAVATPAGDTRADTGGQTPTADGSADQPIVNDAGTNGTVSINGSGTVAIAPALQVFTVPGNPVIPAAKLPLYANTFTELYGVDPKTGTATLIGKFTLGGKAAPDITDIAINTAGSMFAVSGNTIYAVDSVTSALTVVLTHNVTGAYGLTFLNDGTLIIAGDSVNAIDPTTKQSKVLVASGLFGGTSGDIIALPDNKLYWTVFAPNSANNDLVQIDPAANYAAKRLGSTGVPNVFGLGYINGQLIGLSFGGKIFPLSTTTGAAGALITTTGPAIAGAASNPAAK